MRFKTRLFILPLLLLAACGSINANGGSASGPTVLHVSRISSNPYGKHVASFDRTVTDVAAVQRLYMAAYALSATKGTYSCAKDLSLIYHLTFLNGTTPIQKMDLQATGCRFLIINNTDGRQTTDAFIMIFTKTSGIASLIP